MKKLLWGFIPMIACLLFAGCKDDDFGGNSFVKDQAVASIQLGLTLTGPVDVKPMTRATDEQETNVEALALFFYKAGVSTPYFIELDLGDATPTGSGTNYHYTVTVTAEQLDKAGILSNTYTIYAIANWNKTFCRVNLEELKSLSQEELENYCVLKSSNELDLTSTALLLTGKKENVELLPEGSTIEGLHLRRITAKIHFNFSSRSGVTFTPLTYELHNYSRSSTLIERDGWTDKNGNDDGEANNGTHPGTLEYQATSAPNAIVQGRPHQITDKSFYFYMLENVQKPTEENKITDGDWKMREENSYGENNEGPKTFTKAPADATYVVVKGTYSGPISEDDPQVVTGEVAYTIHLGDFSASTGDVNNYTVRRNAKYTYNVTVNGVKDIIVEAQQNGLGNPAAEGNLMNTGDNIFHLDAHFETVMLELDLNAGDEFTLLVKSPYGSQTITSTTEATDLKHFEWIKFGKPATANRQGATFAAYPGDVTFKAGVLDEADYQESSNTKLIDVIGLMSAMKRYLDNSDAVGAQKFFTVYNEKLYVTAYVDEYYYDKPGGELTLPLAGFINADDREMSWASTVSKSDDGHSSYTTSPIFRITQKSIKSPFNMANPEEGLYGIETYEEGLFPNAALDKLDVDNPIQLNWGWRNQWEIFTEDPSSKTEEFLWSRFIKIAANGHFKDEDPKSRDLLELINSEVGDLGVNDNRNKNLIHLYTCLSRNRDEDGDGYIGVHELKWFLPAFYELTTFQFGALDLPQEARLTEQNYYTASKDAYRVLWAQEGAAFGPIGQEQVKHVRCVRTIGADYFRKESISASWAEPMYPANANDNQIIEMDNLNESSLRTSLQRGGYPSHFIPDNSNRLPHAFEIAREDLDTKEFYSYSDVNGQRDLCERYYTEDVGGGDRGEWRIPNQQELTLMVRHYRGENNNKSFLSDYTVARTLYHRATGQECLSIVITDNDSQEHKITTSWDNFGSTGVTQEEYYETSWGRPTRGFKIRCVRDAAHVEN